VAEKTHLRLFYIYMNVTTENCQIAVTRLISYNNFTLYKAGRFV